MLGWKDLLVSLKNGVEPMRLKGFAGLPNGSRGYFQEEQISVINLNCYRIGRMGYQHDLVRQFKLLSFNHNRSTWETLSSCKPHPWLDRPAKDKHSSLFGHS